MGSGLRRNDGYFESRPKFSNSHHRHCERSEAIHRATERKLDCFAALAMTARHNSAFSPRIFARGMPKTSCPDQKRAHGTPGAQSTRSLARKKQKAHQRSHHEYPGSPRRSAHNGLQLTSCSPRRTGLFCHRHQRNGFHRLRHQRRGVRTTRLRCPPRAPSSRHPPRPSHPAPRL
jgi:hypothetical protein